MATEDVDREGGMEMRWRGEGVEGRAEGRVGKLVREENDDALRFLLEELGGCRMEGSREVVGRRLGGGLRGDMWRDGRAHV